MRIFIWCGCGSGVPKWCGSTRIRIHNTDSRKGTWEPCPCVQVTRREPGPPHFSGPGLTGREQHLKNFTILQISHFMLFLFLMTWVPLFWSTRQVLKSLEIICWPTNEPCYLPVPTYPPVPHQLAKIISNSRALRFFKILLLSFSTVNIFQSSWKG